MLVANAVLLFGTRDPHSPLSIFSRDNDAFGLVMDRVTRLWVRGAGIVDNASPGGISTRRQRPASLNNLFRVIRFSAGEARIVTASLSLHDAQELGNILSHDLCADSADMSQIERQVYHVNALAFMDTIQPKPLFNIGTILKNASSFGRDNCLLEKCLRILLKRGVDPSIHRNDALINATSITSADNLSLIILSDSRVDPGDQNNTALCNACSTGQSKTVGRLLRDIRVDPCAQNNSAIISACMGGYFDVVRLLAADPRVDISKALIAVADCKHADGNIARFLLADSRIDPGLENNRALLKACAKGSINIVKALLEDSRVDTAGSLLAAIKADEVEIVRVLLESGKVDPGLNDNEAIIEASLNDYGGGDVMVLLLKDNRTDPAARNNQAFINSLINYKSDMAKLLLLSGRVDPGAQNNLPIRKICSRDNRDLAFVQQLLSDPRVDPSAENNEAIINLCKWNRQVEILSLLLSISHVDPSAQNNQAIINVCNYHNKPDFLEVLLADSRVDPGAQHCEGLKIACILKKMNFVEILVQDKRVRKSRALRLAKQFLDPVYETRVKEIVEKRYQK